MLQTLPTCRSGRLRRIDQGMKPTWGAVHNHVPFVDGFTGAENSRLEDDSPSSAKSRIFERQHEQHMRCRSLFLAALCLPWLASASLPWASGSNSGESVKKSDPISFDPLAVLAILWNPRAQASASRLYAQPSSGHFRWPHMMQIGGVTVAVSVLVNHLTMNYRSIHPAVEMFLGDVDKLTVKSTIGREINLFTTLPLSGSESALIESLNFRSSSSPANDILVVNVGAGAFQNQVAAPSQPGDLQKSTLGRLLGNSIFLATEVGMGLLNVGGLICSILYADFWAVTLFGGYFAHWLASTAISFSHMVVTDPNLRIRQDSHIVYAVYERPSGGWIVFRGTQETMETWARTTWSYVDTVWHRAVHWLWMVSGLVAAIASVANMVNMNGWLQLGFLGMLFYGSAAEVWLTVVSRDLQNQSMTFLGPCSTIGVFANDKKFKSIIQSGLGIDDDHRLSTLKWTALGLLPNRDPFLVLEDVIGHLDIRGSSTKEKEEKLVAALQLFDERCRGLPREDQSTVEGIRSEIERAYLM